MQPELLKESATSKYRTLRVEVTHRFDEIDISQKDLDSVLSMISWQKLPYFPRRGRMGWHVFDSPARLTNGQTRSLVAAKMKGIGVFNPPSDALYRDPVYHISSNQAFQPTNEPLISFSTYPHFGINSEGHYGFAFGKMAPIGGIIHERALNEYSCALHLLRKNVSAIVPLMVVKYTDLPKFDEHSLGAVVCISPSLYPHRLGEVQHGAALRPGIDKSKDTYYHELLRSFQVSSDPNLETTRLDLLKKLAPRAARLIHDFSAAGLFRYSSTLQNFEYDFHRNELVLTDLDSTLSLESLTPQLQRMQVIRDFASLLYHFIVGFGTPLALGHYRLKMLLEADPVADLIAGYFSIPKTHEVKKISQLLWSCFIPHFVLLNRHKPKIDTEWSVERRRSYKMEHDLFYVMAITALYPLFCRSALSEKYPDPLLTQDALLKKAEVYLGGRYEYFEYLLKRNDY